MIPPPKPENEAERLAALYRYEVLDTLGESDFDDLTKLAALICGVPIALVSLIDNERQWFKAKVGLDAAETPRDISFCGHAILGNALFEIPDAVLDQRFSDNPLVTSAPHIRFYAGQPVTSTDGYALGTLCVIDRTPRQLNRAQRVMLGLLATQVVRHLELRLHLRRLENGHQPRPLAQERPRLDRLGTNDVLWGVNVATGEVVTTRKWAGMLGHDVTDNPPTLQQWRALIHPDDLPAMDQAWTHLLSGATPELVCEFRLQTPNHDWRWVRSHGEVMATDEVGRPTVVAGTQADIGGTKEIELSWRQAEERYRLLLELNFDAVMLYHAGRILHANPAALRLAGATTLTDLAGRRVEELIAPTYRPQVAACFGPLEQAPGNPQYLTLAWLRLDGSPVVVEARAARVTFRRQPAIQLLLHPMATP